MYLNSPNINEHLRLFNNLKKTGDSKIPLLLKASELAKDISR